MELDSAKAVSPEGEKGSCSWPGCFEGRGRQDAVTSGWRGAGCGRVLPTPTPQKVKVCRGRKGWLRQGCCTEELGLPGTFGRSSVTSKRGDSFKWTFWLQCCLQPSAPLLRGCGWSASAEKFLEQVRSQCPLAGRPSLGSPRTWPPQAGGQVGVQSHTETLGFAHLINVIVETICQIFYRRVGPPFHGIFWGWGVGGG